MISRLIKEWESIVVECLPNTHEAPALQKKEKRLIMRNYRVKKPTKVLTRAYEEG